MSAKVPHLRRRAILRAARGLLVRRAFSEVSLDEVARSAGVAKGTLFLYFEGKEELLAAAFEDLFEEMGEALAEAARSRRRGLALLEETARAILWEFERNRDFLSQVGPGGVRGCGGGSLKRFRALLGRNMGHMRTILGRLVREGLLPPSRAGEAQAGYLFGLCRSVLFRQAFLGRRVPLARRAREVADQFLYGAAGRRP